MIWFTGTLGKQSGVQSSHRGLAAGMRGKYAENSFEIRLPALEDSEDKQFQLSSFHLRQKKRKKKKTVPAMNHWTAKRKGKRERPGKAMLEEKSQREINPLSAVRGIRGHCWTAPRQSNRPGTLNAPVAFMTHTFIVSQESMTTSSAAGGISVNVLGRKGMAIHLTMSFPPK